MLLKNLFKARDIVSPIPLGIGIILEYDAKGKLHKIYKGKGIEKECFVSQEINQAFRQSNIIPQSIHLRGGSTDIAGVLYINKRYDADGVLPDCIEDQFLADFVLHPGKFRFVAGYLKNSNQAIMGTAIMAQTLRMAGFNVLPYLLLTDPINEAHINKIITKKSFPYGYPLIEGYFIYRNAEVFYVSTNIMQASVSSEADAIQIKSTFRGDLRATIHLNNEQTLECSLAELTKLNIHPNSLITYEDDTNRIIHSYLFDEHYAPQRPDEIPCPTCGRLIKIPESGNTMCPDVHCPSRSYPPINHFLQTLGLQQLSFEQYQAMRKLDENICSIPTILKTHTYADTHIKVPLHKFLASMVPELTEDECFQLVKACKHAKETLVHYMQDPSKITTDLHVQGMWVNKFIRWCSDTKNVDMFTDVLYGGNIEISENMPMFEGAPMFRNTKIAITGTFKHGSLSVVSDILQSYAAEVTTAYALDISLVIVGDIEQNVNGGLITRAKASGIQVIKEDDFFKMYNIDDDLDRLGGR